MFNTLLLYRSDQITRWKASEIRAPPPTAQTRETPHVNTSDAPIFEFSHGSRDKGTFGGFWGVRSGLKKWFSLAHFSALKMKLKFPLGVSKSINLRGLLPKNEPIRPRSLSSRWGCSVFKAFHLVFRSEGKQGKLCVFVIKWYDGILRDAGNAQCAL